MTQPLKKLRKRKHFINHNGHRPNSLIIVESTRKGIYRYLKPQYIPAGTGQRNYHNGALFFLGLDLKGNFWAIDVPRIIVPGESPVDMFIAKHCATEVEEVFGLSTPLMEKIKIGILAGLGIAILIVIFLIVGSMGGV